MDKRLVAAAFLAVTAAPVMVSPVMAMQAGSAGFEEVKGGKFPAPFIGKWATERAACLDQKGNAALLWDIHAKGVRQADGAGTLVSLARNNANDREYQVVMRYEGGGGASEARQLWRLSINEQQIIIANASGASGGGTRSLYRCR